MQPLCANPVVAIYDGFVTDEEAQAAIDAGKDDLAPSQIVSAAGPASSDKRTNTQAVVDQWSNPVLTGLVTRMSSLVRLPPENCEPAKLLHYVGDQKFDTHKDAFTSLTPGGLMQMASGGQRLFTTLCYLNDTDGGETVFPDLRISVRPRKGRVLLFQNTIPGQTEAHPHSRHTGTAINSGEKWVLSLWWREELFHMPREFPAETGPLRDV